MSDRVEESAEDRLTALGGSAAAAQSSDSCSLLVSHVSSFENMTEQDEVLIQDACQLRPEGFTSDLLPLRTCFKDYLCRIFMPNFNISIH